MQVRAAGGLLNFLDQNKRNCLDGSQDCHVIRGLVSSDLWEEMFYPLVFWHFLLVWWSSLGEASYVQILK